MVEQAYRALDSSHDLHPAPPHAAQVRASEEAGVPITAEHVATECGLVLIPFEPEPLYVGVFPITARQWALVMGATGDRRGPPTDVLAYWRERLRKRSSSGGPELDSDWLELPVTDVMLDEIDEFLEAAGGGLRVPTREEWRRACYGGEESHQPYWWGDNWIPYMSNTAWEQEGRPTPIWSNPPTEFGLYDLLGNVWELCLNERNGRRDWGMCGGSYASAPEVVSIQDWKRVENRWREGRWFDEYTGFRCVVEASKVGPNLVEPS